MVGDEPTDDEVRRVLSALPEAEAEGEHLDDAVLVAHRKGALGEAEVEEADRHLAACAACREMLVDLAVEPDGASIERAVAAMEAESGNRWGRLQRWGGGLAVAAAAVLVLSNMGVGRVVPVSEPMVHELTGFEGVQAEKGGPAEEGGVKERLFHRETSVATKLRPAQDLKTPTSLSVFVSRPGQPLERVAATGVAGATDDTPMLVVTRSESGTFRVQGRGRHLFRAGAGDYLVSFVIAAPESRCTTMDGIGLEEARAKCTDAVDWHDVKARFEP